MTAGTTREPATVGPYRLVRKLGEGGMGVVHLASDPAGRAVAIKVLRAHVANDDEARRRLSREVATLRRVRHPQVAEVLDADVVGAEPYLVTRYVPGRSLDEEVRSTGPLPAGQVARIGRTLAEALAGIHAVGVVHRDVKPANVMLVEGEPVLIDFGIAHLADESRITRTGLVMGTPGYLSPELIYGGGVTTATDWWAWGATMVFAATGRQPFGSGPVEVILERVRRGTADLDGIEPGLRELLADTLAIDAQRRPSSAELLNRLNAVISGVSTAPAVVDGGGRRAAGPHDLTVRTAPPAASPPLDRTKRMPPPATPAGRPTAAAAGLANGPGSVIPPYPGARAAPFRPPAYGTPAYQRTAQPYPAQPTPYGAPAHQHPQQAYSNQAYPHQAAAHGAPPYPQQPTPYPFAVPPGAVDHPDPRSRAAAPRQPHPPQQTSAAPSRPRATDESVRVTGTVAAVVLALAAVAMVAPGAAVVTVFALSVLARLVQRSHAGLQRRRQELGGPRSTDVAVTVAALPWRSMMSVLMSLAGLVLPALVATSTAFIVGSAGLEGGGAPEPSSALALFTGMLAGAATAWWGPGGRSLRTGSRTVLRAVTRGRGGRVALASLCVLLVVAAVMIVAGPGYAPDWSPLPPPRSLIG